MYRFRRLCWAAVATAGVLLSACQRDNAGSSTPAAPVAALDRAAQDRAAAQIAAPAWLRERLPEHTVAYMRLPSFWGLLSAPSGRPLDAALASEAHTRLIAQLRDAARKDPLLAQTGVGPAIGLFLGDMASPIEIAAIDGGDILGPASYVLVTVRLDVADVATFNARAAALVQDEPLLKAPLDASGKGALAKNGFVYFDAAQHRLYALFGTGATGAQLDSYLTALATPRSHPMFDSERAIDSSGQGLFVWIGLKGITGMASAQIPASKPGTLLRDFLDKSRAIAFGWGTVNGHGRLQYVFEAPQARLLEYLAPGKVEAAVRTAGAPRWTVTIALPGADRLAALESHLDADFAPGSADVYRAGMGKMKDKLGMDLTDLLRLAGPDLLFFEDDNGRYAALRVADAKGLYAHIDDLAKRYDGRHEVLTSGKASVHHLTLPALTGAAGAGQDISPWLKIYQRIGSHWYWMEDGNYFIFASVPQSLADRAAANLDTNLNEWLLKTQNYDAGSTLMGATATTQQVQREFYYAYLGVLQLLGDALGQPVDLSPLPSAGSLHLPAQGSVSLRLDTTRERIGFSVGYEQSPAELIFGGGGGIAAVGVVGILAAIAIPAYDDYSVRSQVVGGLIVADAAKTAVAEYYASNGKLPDDASELGLPESDAMGSYLQDASVDHGNIVLTYGDQSNTKIHGKVLVLRPYLNAQKNLSWACGTAQPPDAARTLGTTKAVTDIPAKYLPAYCR